MAVIQHLDFTEEKIRHWSKPPRVTVAKLCLLPRTPELRRALPLLISILFPVLWQETDNLHFQS